MSYVVFLYHVDSSCYVHWSTYLTHCLLVSSAHNLCKQFVWIQTRPDNVLGLIWIQTAWHSDGIPEIIFKKVDFEKNQMTKKHAKLPRGQRLNGYLVKAKLFNQVYILRGPQKLRKAGSNKTQTHKINNHRTKQV